MRVMSGTERPGTAVLGCRHTQARRGRDGRGAEPVVMVQARVRRGLPFCPRGVVASVAASSAAPPEEEEPRPPPPLLIIARSLMNRKQRRAQRRSSFEVECLGCVCIGRGAGMGVGMGFASKEIQTRPRERRTHVRGAEGREKNG